MATSEAGAATLGVVFASDPSAHYCGAKNPRQKRDYTEAVVAHSTVT
jgi:hypothetical protein